MLPFSGVLTTILRDPRLVMKATPAEFVLPKIQKMLLQPEHWHPFNSLRRKAQSMSEYPPVTTF